MVSLFFNVLTNVGQLTASQPKAERIETTISPVLQSGVETSMACACDSGFKNLNIKYAVVNTMM